MIDDLEKLFADLEPDELAREVLREEHRQLEKDLLRLVDPLPPANFVETVMSKVAKQSQLPSRREGYFALLLVSMSLAAATMIFISLGMPASRLGLMLASAAVFFREACLGLESGLTAIWKTSALPAAVILFSILASGSFVFRRLLPSKETV
jgi:hypothetical protein